MSHGHAPKGEPSGLEYVDPLTRWDKVLAWTVAIVGALMLGVSFLGMCGWWA